MKDGGEGLFLGVLVQRDESIAEISTNNLLHLPLWPLYGSSLSALRGESLNCAAA